jgi:putative transposase
VFTVVQHNESSYENVGAGRSLLDEIVRDGARQMLAAALAAEVAAYVEQFADQVDANGHRLVVRNGYHRERDVLTAAGAVRVEARASTTAASTPIPVNGSGSPRRYCRRGRVSRRR